MYEEQKIDFVLKDANVGYDNRKKNERRQQNRRRRQRLRGEDVDDVNNSGPSDQSSDSSTQQTAREVCEPMSEREKMKAGRKKLPVYPYREEFLRAVKDHQVLILVGETGSGKT